MANRLGRIRVSGKVALTRRIAPRALWVPVPCLHEKLCILPIAHHAPAGFENLADLVGRKEYIGGVARNSIHSCTERIERAEGIYAVTGRDIDANRLRHRCRRDPEK